MGRHTEITLKVGTCAIVWRWPLRILYSGCRHCSGPFPSRDFWGVLPVGTPALWRDSRLCSGGRSADTLHGVGTPGIVWDIVWA